MPRKQAPTCCRSQQATFRQSEATATLNWAPCYKLQRFGGRCPTSAAPAGWAATPEQVMPEATTLGCSQHKSSPESQPSVSWYIPKSAALQGCRVPVTSYWNGWITSFPEYKLLSSSQLWSCPCLSVPSFSLCQAGGEALAPPKASSLTEGIQRKGSEQSFRGRADYLRNKRLTRLWGREVIRKANFTMSAATSQSLKSKRWPVALLTLIIKPLGRALGRGQIPVIEGNEV